MQIQREGPKPYTIQRRIEIGQGVAHCWSNRIIGARNCCCRQKYWPFFTLVESLKLGDIQCYSSGNP
jgi:hypothetical protein